VIKNLSKSRFKIALDCATKAYYDANRDIYTNQSLCDKTSQFYKLVGNQVGELVKYWYRQKDPRAIEIENEQQDQQIEETQLLEEVMK
jgi:gas vesicle protein